MKVHLACATPSMCLLQNGNIKKGPVGVGVRIQENMRVGPLKVEAVAAQVGELDWGRCVTPLSGVLGDRCCVCDIADEMSTQTSARVCLSSRTAVWDGSNT